MFHNDGPWEVDEHYRKLNGVLRYSQGSRHNGFSLTGMAYQGQWTSTDQVARRAVDSGLVGRFGTLDPTTGGETHRYSLSGEWAKRWESAQSKANAWWLKSGLDLWSNFQYCASNGCPPGDQFKQAERRQAGGFAVSHAMFDRWGGFDVENSIGLQGRVDHLNPVGLYWTSGRQTQSTVREDKVTQRSLSLWLQNETRWTGWFRSVQGLRADAYDFSVDSSIAANSGKASDQMLTPKLALIFGPWQKTELYLNYGHGFHSNDARGTTIRVNSADGVTPVHSVKPLVRTRGYEMGVRSEPLAGWQSTLSLWQLAAASELLLSAMPARPKPHAHRVVTAWSGPIFMCWLTGWPSTPIWPGRTPDSAITTRWLVITFRERCSRPPISALPSIILAHGSVPCVCAISVPAR